LRAADCRIKTASFTPAVAQLTATDKIPTASTPQGDGQQANESRGNGHLAATYMGGATAAAFEPPEAALHLVFTA